MKTLYSISLLVVILLSLNTLALSENTGPDRPIFEGRTITTGSVIEFSPNPVDQYLTVRVKDERLANIRFEVYNIIGNKLNVPVQRASSSLFMLDVKNCISGYYLLVVKDESHQFSKAFKFQKL